MNDLEFVFLEFKHIYKTQRTNLLSFYLFIFYSLFLNHSVYQRSPPFCSFPLCVNTQDDINTQDDTVLFLLVGSQSLCVLTLSTFGTRAGSLKGTPKWTFYVIYLQSRFSWWSLNFLLRLDLPQLKLECLNCQKSDISTNSPCCTVLLRTSFSFLQVNQQKRVEMVFTNNIKYSEQICRSTFFVEIIPHYVFD